MREEAKPEISELIQKNRSLLYYVIRPIVGNENLVDDCYGEVSEIIVKKYDTYDAEKGSLTAWLTRVAHNAAVNFVKNRNMQFTAGAEEPTEAVENNPVLQETETPETILLRKENAAELREALKRLKPAEKKLILRKYYYMQPMAQIAAEMGMSLRAAEGKLYRIKKKLLADIEKQRKGGSQNE